jgi:predicted N-acetyltransferase YhbS
MLAIHPASDAERIELYRNVHDVWGRGLPLEEHVHRRLASPQHNRATWFVGCVEGRVIASLGIYALEFRYRGEIVPGMAIGAVHTHADFRGRGYAPQLIRWVEERYHRESGTAVSLLYSDIDPGYYARLGYVECPAWELDFEPGAAGRLFDDINPVEFHAVPLADAGRLMSDAYDAFHRDLPISIHRTADYWDHLREKAPHDEVFAIGSPAIPNGYVRIGRRESSMIVRDFATTDAAELPRLLAAVAEIGRQTGAAHVTGWVPRLAGDLAPLSVRRAEEITMLKPLSPALSIENSVVAAAEWFHEIDHV